MIVFPELLIEKKIMKIMKIHKKILFSVFSSPPTIVVPCFGLVSSSLSWFGFKFQLSSLLWIRSFFVFSFLFLFLASGLSLSLRKWKKNKKIRKL